MFRNSLTTSMIYFKRIKYIMIQKKNSKENKCSFSRRSFKPSNCLWKLHECKYYVASLLSVLSNQYNFGLKNIVQWRNTIYRLHWYIFGIDIHKNYINSGYVKLIPSKICTARKRVAEQKFAGQRLLPGHWSM